MSFSIQRLRALLPGGSSQNASAANIATRHSVSLEPEIGFQITIETNTITANANDNVHNDVTAAAYHKTSVPELNVHLIAARHLPALFGFKIVQGYLIKVKLFPGSKRLDSSIQTNSWPKYNENFKFPLTPEIKPSLKHSSRRGSKIVSEFTPEDLFAGQFVVFTVYALLELPPASFNRFNKTYRSLRDKSTNLMQKVVETSSGKTKEDTENASNTKENATAITNGSSSTQKVKRKPSDKHPRDAMPPLTISESRRNIGSVTCYLEPKIFKRNARNGLFTTEELWLPIKDIATSVVKNCNNNNNNGNNLANSAKGVIEIILEVRDLRIIAAQQEEEKVKGNSQSDSTTKTKVNNENLHVKDATAVSSTDTTTTTTITASAPTNTNGTTKNPQWTRMTSEVKRKMGISNVNSAKAEQDQLALRITTARMRCSNKVKDELESTAGSVYVKTTIFEHGIYVDSWKSTNFYPSLSTKWNVGEAATLSIPLQHLDNLENMLIRTTLATKTKMGKKLVLGTVLVGAQVTAGNGAEHIKLLLDTAVNEPVPMWHNYQ